MKFLFCGGSNTDFSKIAPKTNLKVNQGYPDIVSKYYGASYVNEGKRNGSNKRTVRKIFYDYDMEEFDFICIDFTPKLRTEFYNDRDKRWEKITDKSGNLELSKLYYENFYNNEYGSLMECIQFTSIRKYLKALKKPHLIFNSGICKNNNLDFDLHFLDYHTKEYHLTSIGHRQVANQIIKYCENTLQRG